ncbi:hypothetical protein V6N13_092507 [Hibiscus sabdariffa]|uniref:DUF4408 domain-containing protein n=1 Tax=Hibiscus sabdariffa TaxID=183260 RepID=A0ABR2CEH0_9ROSI
MDEYEKLRGVGKYQFLKNTLQIVIWVAFVSIFLCHSSSFAYSLFPHSFNVYFSTFLFSLFTHTLERKYMFLLCNGILAFIAKTSVSNRSTSNVTETKLASEIDGGEYDQIRHVPRQVEEPEKGSLEEGEEEESEASVVVEDDISGGEEDKEGEKGWPVKQEEEEEVAVSMSTEELNRKIEEFIRKMKEEIRIEAQQQQMIASN